VLPEALLARDDNDPDLSVKSAQPLDGGFLQLLLAESAGNTMTTILTMHVPLRRDGRRIRWWRFVKGDIAHYAKLHLYDAFSIQESRRVDPGRFRR
jgi:predicted amidohydrolase